MIKPRVSIVILNWNGYEETRSCLKSLQQISYPNFEVIVVDNGSKDGSEEKLRKEFPEITIIQTGKNLGFAGGNNVGIKHALITGTDFIMLLNSDTVVERGFLEPLVRFLGENDRVGAVQPKLMRAGKEKVIDSLGHEIFKFIACDIAFGEEENELVNKPKEIFGPCAAAALYKRIVFEKTGLLNERFFMVFEDVDFSWRMREVGFSSWLIPTSIVYHKRGVSGGTSSEVVAFHAEKNKLYLKVRYYPFSLRDYWEELKKFVTLSQMAKKLYNISDLIWFISAAFFHRLTNRLIDKEIYANWAQDEGK